MERLAKKSGSGSRSRNMQLVDGAFSGHTQATNRNDQMDAGGPDCGSDGRRVVAEGSQGQGAAGEATARADRLSATFGLQK